MLLYLLLLILYFYFFSITFPLTLIAIVIWLMYGIAKGTIWAAKHPRLAAYGALGFVEGVLGEFKFLLSAKVWAAGAVCCIGAIGLMAVALKMMGV